MAKGRTSMTAECRRCLAWDPGPTVCWWASALAGEHGIILFGGAGSIPTADASRLEALLDDEAVRNPGGLVAVEIPGALHPRAGASPANLFARSKQLLDTARAAQRIVDAARVRGLVTVEMTAGQWRHALTRKNNASDQLIKRAVTMFSLGLPKRTSAHVRDAFGLAMIALRASQSRQGGSHG